MSSVHGSGEVRRSASTLSSLFTGGGASRSLGGVAEDDSLRYVAPKEPKQQAHAPSQQSSKDASSAAPSSVVQQPTAQQGVVQAAQISNSIVSSGTLRLYVFSNTNNAYEAHLGGMPLGFVILGGAKEMLFIYDANKAPQCSLLLNSSCELKVQPNNYVSLSNHAQAVFISVLLESEAAIEAFCRCIVAAKGYNMQRDAAYTPDGPLRHEVTIEGRDEAALGHGDVAGVRYALYELAVDTSIAASLREPCDTNAGADVVKVKVGTGETAPVGGLSTALIGARKGGRYLILVPPSIAGRPNSQCWVMAEVEVVKIKKTSSKGSSANLPQPHTAVAEPSTMSRDVSYDVETEAPETVRPPQQQPQAGHSKNDLVHRMAALAMAGRVGGLPIPNILPHRQTNADHSDDTPDDLSLHPPAPPPAEPQTHHQPTSTPSAPMPQMSLSVPSYQQPSLRTTNLRSQSQTPSVTSQREGPWADDASLAHVAAQPEHARESYSHLQPSMTNSIASGAPPSPSSSLVHATESGISASATTALSALVLQSQQTQQGIFQLQTLLNDLNMKVDRNLSGRQETTTFTKMGGRYSTEEWLGSFRMLLEEHERLESSSKEGPDKIAKLHDKIQQLQERISDLQDKNAQLMMEKTGMLEAAMHRNAEFAIKEKGLHDEIQELKSRDKAAAEDDRVTELLAELAAARDEGEREAAERTRLEGELSAALAQIDELQGQLSAAEAINANLSEELETLRTAMSAEEQSTEMHDELWARLAAETKRAEALEAEAAAQGSRAEEGEGRAAALQEEVNTLRARVQALATELATSSSSNEGGAQTDAAPAPAPPAEPPGPTPEMVKSFLAAVFVRTQEVFLAEDLRESSFGAEEVVKRIRAILRGCAQDLLQPGGNEE